MLAMGLPEVAVDGEVLEADPPRKLVQTWRFLWDEEIAAEGPTRVTFDIEEDDGGVTRLTVTHELENAPRTAAQLAGVGRDPRGRRRLELDPQRPQDAARDRRGARGLTSVTGWRPCASRASTLDRAHAVARSSSRSRTRTLWVSDAARSNSSRASSSRPSLTSRSPRTLGRRW